MAVPISNRKKEKDLIVNDWVLVHQYVRIKNSKLV